jgi:hypothetical protein
VDLIDLDEHSASLDHLTDAARFRYDVAARHDAVGRLLDLGPELLVLAGVLDLLARTALRLQVL